MSACVVCGQEAESALTCSPACASAALEQRVIPPRFTVTVTGTWRIDENGVRPARTPRRRRCRLCNDLYPPAELHDGMCDACYVVGPPPLSESYSPPPNTYGIYVGAPASARGIIDPSEEFRRAQTEIIQRLEPSPALQAMIAGWSNDAERRATDSPARRGAGWFDAPDFDLWACLEASPQNGWTHADIAACLAYVPPTTVDDNWHWILRLRDDRYVYFVAWNQRGWNHDGVSEAHLGESPYDCLAGYQQPDERVYRELVRQIVESMLADTRRRIAESMARTPTHTVHQAMGFETNHCWVCENCGFVSVDDLKARAHSEMPEAKAGPPRLRRERSLPEKTVDAKRRLRGPRRDL